MASDDLERQRPRDIRGMEPIVGVRHVDRASADSVRTKHGTIDAFSGGHQCIVRAQ
jgi:hypothetical protein